MYYFEPCRIACDELKHWIVKVFDNLDFEQYRINWTEYFNYKQLLFL